MTAMLRVAAVVLVAAGGWTVWIVGGRLLALAGLDDLDVIGRTVLVFAFLTGCGAGENLVAARAHGKIIKVFCFFFSKKKTFFLFTKQK